jgi:hypothetical protein
LEKGKTTCKESQETKKTKSKADEVPGENREEVEDAEGSVIVGVGVGRMLM